MTVEEGLKKLYCGFTVWSLSYRITVPGSFDIFGVPVSKLISQSAFYSFVIAVGKMKIRYLLASARVQWVNNVNKIYFKNWLQWGKTNWRSQINERFSSTFMFMKRFITHMNIIYQNIWYKNKQSI